MALPILIDQENDNPIDYTTDLVKKMYDTLKDIITLGDEKTGDADADNSDVAVKFTRLKGYAGWSSNPRLVGSNMGLADQNIWFYSKIDVNAFSDNWLSDFRYIGGNNHFTEFGNPYPSAEQQGIIDAIQDNYMDMIIRVKPELSSIMTGFYLAYDTGRDFAHITYDNNGVLGDTIYTNNTSMLFYDSPKINSNSMCQIYYSSADYTMGTDYWGSPALVDYPDSTYIEGSTSDLETIHYYTDMPSVIINPTTNSTSITNINNTFNQNNTNNYYDTYTYNNQTYNYYYGDSYITIYYPDGSDGLPFNDVRNIFNDTLENLNIDVVLPSYTDIKYADQGSFYITPVKQIPPLMPAPDIADTVVDVSDYVTLLGGSLQKCLDIFDTLGLELMLTFTFLSCLVIRHLKR